VSGKEGRWTADPAGVIDKAGDILIASRAKPTLYGEWSATYSAAAKRWLPVPRDHVRSDGLAYAYAETYRSTPTAGLDDATRLRVVSLVDGSSRVIYAGAARGVVAYAPDGIYVTAVTLYSDYSQGLWRLDPATGKSTKVLDGYATGLIDRGALWINRGIPPNSLLRTQISTRVTQTWIDSPPGSYAWFVGLDASGHPIVDVGQGDYFAGATWRVYVYTSPRSRTSVGDAAVREIGVNDTYGTWLAGEDGIYLLRPGGTVLDKVSNVTGGNVAGPCTPASA